MKIISLLIKIMNNLKPLKKLKNKKFKFKIKINPIIYKVYPQTPKLKLVTLIKIHLKMMKIGNKL